VDLLDTTGDRQNQLQEDELGSEKEQVQVESTEEPENPKDRRRRWLMETVEEVINH
jgi:hypothetical protein